MDFDESEIHAIYDLIHTLNSKKNCMVVVEGKKDEIAMKKLGYSGKICQFHSFKGLTRFVDSMTRYKNLILLFDFDRKGNHLTRRVISQLERRVSIDLSFRKKLTKITKGKIKHIEDLSWCTM